MTDKKSNMSGAVTVVIAIIAIVIFIYLFIIKKAVACPRGTDTYMKLELFAPDPDLIKILWYDQFEGENLDTIMRKEPEYVMPFLDDMWGWGRILSVQYDCAIWQYKFLV